MIAARPRQHPAGRRSAGQAAELRGHPGRARREPDQGELGARGAGAACSRTTSPSCSSTCACPSSTASSWRKMLREHPRYEKTAIIFISAIHLSDVDRIRGYETGAVDYVPVPVIPEILRAKVQDLRRALPQDAAAGEAQRRARAARRASARPRWRRRPRSCARARSGCVSPARRRASAPTTTTRPPARSIGRRICGGSSASRATSR